MILVDSSVWIDYFNGVQSAETDSLVRLIRTTRGLLVGDLILTEVLQGLRSESDAQRVLSHFRLFEFRSMVSPQLAIASARNYRLLRSRGSSVRTTIDCLIATFCIVQDHELLHGDRDFAAFERHLGLRVVRV